MQNFIPHALVLGALILGAALIYHARQLAHLSAQLQVTQQRISTLDTNLQEFARDLPKFIEQAGENAGRQAVHGMADEAVQMPLNWLRSIPLNSLADALRRQLSPASSRTPRTNQATPLVQLEPPGRDQQNTAPLTNPATDQMQNPPASLE